MIRGEKKNQVVCPVCGKVIDVKKEDLYFNYNVICPGCSVRIELDDDFLYQFGLIKH